MAKKKTGSLPQLRAVRSNYGASATTWDLVSVATGGLVANAYNYPQEIVRACNSHDSLVAAARAARDALSRVYGPELGPKGRDYGLIERLDKVITEAQ